MTAAASMPADADTAWPRPRRLYVIGVQTGNAAPARRFDTAGLGWDHSKPDYRND
jgi:hypothetical protein